jgi:hypothetical protein
MLLYENWKVSRSWESPSVYTNLYPGTRFTFGDNRTMHARKDTSYTLLETGTWQNTGIDDQSAVLEFQFQQPTSFQALNNVWVASKIDEGHLVLRSKANPADSLMLVFR